MLTLANISFGLLGAFYMFGGYALVRATAMDGLIDTAIARLSLLNEDPVAAEADRFKSLFLSAMAIICFAGGAFLFFQSALAPAFFCIGLIMQLLHILVLGPKYFDLHEDDELKASGRRATVNAMFIYLLVTLILFYAQYRGILPSLLLSWSPQDSAGLALTIAFALYALRLLVTSNHRSSTRSGSATGIQQSFDGRDQASHTEGPNSTQPFKLADVAEFRLQAVAQDYGLWIRYQENDSWHTIQPDEIGLSTALELRISSWEDRYDSFWGMEEITAPHAGPSWTTAERRRHFEEALAIAQLLKVELASIYPDKIKISWINEGGEILDI